MVQGRQIKMNAETAKFGKKPEKFYKLEITTTVNGELQVQESSNGFNPYEIVGFLEAIQQNIVNNKKSG